MGSARMWRLVALLSVFAMLAVACSRTPPGQVSVGEDPGEGGGSQASELGETDTGAGFGSDESGESGFDVGETGDSGATTGGSDGGGTGSATTGGTTAGQGTAGDDGGSTPGGTADGGDTGSTDSGTGGTGGTPASGPGIEGDTIKIVFHAQQSDCPDNPPSSGNPSEESLEKGRLVIAEYVKFFNEYVLEEHGWQFEHEVVDDGGQFCPERQRAAALKITEEIQPFAALGYSVSAQGPIVADRVTRAGIRHIGVSWPNYGDLRARAPYAWSTNAIPEKGLEALVGWMDRRLKGTAFERGGPAGNAPVDRVYGLVGTDHELGHLLADVTVERLRARGFELANTYFVSPDPGVAAQQGTTLVSQMRQDGVNSLVWALSEAGYESGVSLSNAMSNQNYLPDVLIGTYGVAFFDQLHDRRVWANAKGVSGCVIVCLRVEVEADGSVSDEYENIAENDDAYIKAWHHMGHNDNPQEGSNPSASEIWKQLALLATGVIHSGETLTPQSFSDGLDTAKEFGTPNRCTVGRFMGRDYEHGVSFEWDSSHDGGGDTFTTIYWVNRQTALNSNGFYESDDNYVYFTDAAQLSPEPSHDTGAEGVDVEKQEQIGIDPWESCSEFPNYR